MARETGNTVAACDGTDEMEPAKLAARAAGIDDNTYTEQALF